MVSFVAKFNEMLNCLSSNWTDFFFYTIYNQINNVRQFLRQQIHTFHWWFSTFPRKTSVRQPSNCNDIIHHICQTSSILRYVCLLVGVFLFLALSIYLLFFMWLFFFDGSNAFQSLNRYKWLCALLLWAQPCMHQFFFSLSHSHFQSLFDYLFIYLFRLSYFAISSILLMSYYEKSVISQGFFSLFGWKIEREKTILVFVCCNQDIFIWYLSRPGLLVSSTPVFG